ncbi:MAG TPA: hypothetical protein VFK57_05735 [Vicinamibacterales bacterium]|nr:hypothetical protein [Vicinamibacterales bacterium]
MQPLDPKSCPLDELIAIQMAAASQPLPYRCEPVLPRGDTQFRRATVLDEQQLAVRSQDPSNLSERSRDVGNRTERRARTAFSPKWVAFILFSSIGLQRADPPIVWPFEAGG